MADQLRMNNRMREILDHLGMDATDRTKLPPKLEKLARAVEAAPDVDAAIGAGFPSEEGSERSVAIHDLLAEKSATKLALYALTLHERYYRRFAGAPRVALYAYLYLDDHEGNGQGAIVGAKLDDAAENARSEDLEKYQMDGILVLNGTPTVELRPDPAPAKKDPPTKKAAAKHPASKKKLVAKKKPEPNKKLKPKKKAPVKKHSKR